MLSKLTQNGSAKNGHARHDDADKKYSSNGIHQNGVKRITDINDYYISGLTDSRTKSE